MISKFNEPVCLYKNTKSYQIYQVNHKIINNNTSKHYCKEANEVIVSKQGHEGSE